MIERLWKYVVWMLATLCLSACQEESAPSSLTPSLYVHGVELLSPTEAFLPVSFDPLGTEVVTSAVFHFGITEAMEQSFTAHLSGRTATAMLEGLQAGTTYYYCLEIGNGADILRSEVRQFTTEPVIEVQSLTNSILIEAVETQFGRSFQKEADGTVLLAVDIKCEFESALTIYDYIQMQKDVRGLSVKCIWQGFDKTYQIEMVHDTPISKSIDGINLYDYWNSKKPHLLKGLDLNAPAVSALDEKKKRSGLYIPQSLKPVITREYIAAHDQTLSAQVDQFTKLSMKKRLKIIRTFLDAINSSGQIVDTAPVPVSELCYQEMSLEKDLPSLLIANGRRIKFSEKYKAFTQGFYKLPEMPILAAFRESANIMLFGLRQKNLFQKH